MEHKGFYCAGRKDEAYGFSVALVWIPEEKDIQFSIMLGNLMFAIGWTF